MRRFGLAFLAFGDFGSWDAGYIYGFESWFGFWIWGGETGYEVPQRRLWNWGSRDGNDQEDIGYMGMSHHA
jgi:hypothetical protein